MRAIGDVVLSTIVLENLKSAFPAANIDFLTEKYCSGIVKGHPLLNRVIPFDKNYLFLENNAHLFKSLSFLRYVRKQKYDLVFDFFGNPRSAIITLFSGAQHRIGYDFRIRKWVYNHTVVSRASQVHEAEWHLDALKAMNIPIVSKRLSIAVSKANLDFAGRYWRQNQFSQKQVVALNFSGGWPAKLWPMSRYAELAETLVNNYSCEILIIWGPGERDKALHLHEQTRVKTSLIPKTNLKELAAILSRVTVMITTDSGPMHIAAAMQTPCIALFGPTHPQLQGPYGKNHQVVVAESVDCLGCNRTTCNNNRCMQLITVQQLLKAADMILRKTRSGGKNP